MVIWRVPSHHRHRAKEEGLSAITGEFRTPPSYHPQTRTATSTTAPRALTTTTTAAATASLMDSTPPATTTTTTNANSAEGGRQSFIGGFFQRARPHTRNNNNQPVDSDGERDGGGGGGGSGGTGSRRQRGELANGSTNSRNTTTGRADAAGTLSSMLRRRPSTLTTATTAAVAATGRPATAQTNAAQASAVGHSHGGSSNAATHGGGGGGSTFTSRAIHHIRLVPHLENQTSLRFDPISREVREGDPPLRIGRFTDRHNHSNPDRGGNRLAFKSKVVSRGHAEIWVDGGKFFLKDTKSSSGTFLNHQRLALPNNESRPFPLKDGDIVQLGVDFQGGTQDIYKCVRIRIELGREWQKTANAFNSQAMKALKALTNLNTSNGDLQLEGRKKKRKNKGSGQDCCICLFSLTICQSIFVAPCSHAFHYKCIRPLLTQQYPGFSCPLCRTWADLEEDVEVDEDEESDSDVEMAVEASLIGDKTMLNDAISKDKPLPPTSAVDVVASSTYGNTHRHLLHPHAESDADIDPYTTGVSDAEFTMPVAAERSVMSVDLDERDRDAEEAEAQAVRDGGREQHHVGMGMGTGTDSEGEVVRGVTEGEGDDVDGGGYDDDDGEEDSSQEDHHHQQQRRGVPLHPHHHPLQSQSQPNLAAATHTSSGRVVGLGPTRSQTMALSIGTIGLAGSPPTTSAAGEGYHYGGGGGRSTSAGGAGGTLVFPHHLNYGHAVYSDTEATLSGGGGGGGRYQQQQHTPRSATTPAGGGGGGRRRVGSFGVMTASSPPVSPHGTGTGTGMGGQGGYVDEDTSGGGGASGSAGGSTDGFSGSTSIRNVGEKRKR